jgi:hypothetical protein
MELSAVEVVEHARSADEDDAARGLACLVGERSGEEGLSGARHSDEEGVDPLGEEGEVVQGEVAGADLLAPWVEVEVEAVDGVDLWEAGVAEATVDGAAEAALLLLVAERRWRTSSVERLSLAARSSSVSACLAIPGSLSQRSF